MLDFVDLDDLSIKPEMAVDYDKRLDSRSILSSFLELIKDEKNKEDCQLLIDNFSWENQKLSQDDMAERYGITPECFKQRLKRSRKKIKKLLDWT